MALLIVCEESQESDELERSNKITFTTPRGKEIEFVKVVRCKDCRFCMAFKDKSYGFYGHCRIWITRAISDHAALVDADDYCSSGERKEGEG